MYQYIKTMKEMINYNDDTKEIIKYNNLNWPGILNNWRFWI